MTFCTLGALLAADAPQPETGFPWQLLIPFVGLFLLYQVMVVRPQRREQAKRNDMLGQLKKNDPVVTIGGILATVVSVAEDGSEVTIKVDDNARLRVRRDAIREVVVKPAPKEAESK